MPRNIVVCCDGTNNQFGSCNTSVVRFVEILSRDAKKQIVYYDPGIGTLPDPRLITRVGQRMSTWIALAFGADLKEKVITAYTHLMDVYEPGDKIFLFGFSRGAYTVRVLAGLLHAVGLLPAGNTQLLPYAVRLYSGSRHAKDKGYWDVLKRFRDTFSRSVDGLSDHSFPTHFLGLFDTVSSVGWAWDPARYPYTARNPSVAMVRHAVSLDERRWFFRQNLFSRSVDKEGKPLKGQDIAEVWFAGVHSDVGGGYPEQDGGLWREPFEWMLSGARIAGIVIDETRLSSVRTQSPVSATPYSDPQHESLVGAMWWAAEFFPKRVYDGDTKKYSVEIGRGRHRLVEDGAILHGSVVERLRSNVQYDPPNLSQAFQQRVKRMETVPFIVPYHPV